MPSSENNNVAESIEVVAGNPTPQELAAIAAVLDEALVSQGQASSRESSWAKGSRMLRDSKDPANVEWRSDFKGGI